MRTVEPRTKKNGRPVRARGGMAVRIAGRLEIPEWVRDHESFRRWARSPECPEKARLAFYDGDLWVDPDMEQLHVHNQVKTKVAVTLVPLVESADLGTYVGDGMLLSHTPVGLSTVPDGCFISFEAFETGRVREVAGQRDGFTELEGSPEMVLEVVSDSSETKDLVDLRELYWHAGITEYWVIDARTEDVRFELLRRGPKGYTAGRRQAGDWQKSDVFGRSFRVTRSQNRRGRPVYSLEVR